jgi:hypothetical protein
MKEHKERTTNPKSKSILLVALLGAAALGISASGAYAQIIITPNQFTTSSWNNLTTSTAGTPYPGDPGFGYYQTSNYGASPSALINIPLTGLTPGWNLYNIYEWNPVVTSQYHVVNIINNGIGYGTSVVPGEPWAGQFGTQQQYLQVNGAPAGQWVELGPGPQADPALGNQEVWINGSGAPSYLQVHYLGFENSLETFDAFKVSQVVVPEPSSLALALLGGFALLTNIRRAKH